MLRWIVVLMAVSLITFLLGWGVIPTAASGLARTLCFVFLGLLGVSLVGGDPEILSVAGGFFRFTK